MHTLVAAAKRSLSLSVHWRLRWVVWNDMGPSQLPWSPLTCALRWKPHRLWQPPTTPPPERSRHPLQPRARRPGSPSRPPSRRSFPLSLPCRGQGSAPSSLAPPSVSSSRAARRRTAPPVPRHRQPQPRGGKPSETAAAWSSGLPPLPGGPCPQAAAQLPCLPAGSGLEAPRGALPLLLQLRHRRWLHLDGVHQPHSLCPMRGRQPHLARLHTAAQLVPGVPAPVPAATLCHDSATTTTCTDLPAAPPPPPPGAVRFAPRPGLEVLPPLPSLCKNISMFVKPNRSMMKIYFIMNLIDGIHVCVLLYKYSQT